MAALVVITSMLVPMPAAAEDASAECGASSGTSSSSPAYSFAVGAQLGVLMPVGLGAILSLRPEKKLRWEFDAVWEPSNYLQSYSVGGAYHPWDKLFFVGVRLRWMQLHPPWSRGFQARTDNQLGVGPEAGVRFAIGPSQRALAFASVGMIVFPSETLSLPPMYTLNIGAAVDVLVGPQRP